MQRSSSARPSSARPSSALSNRSSSARRTRTKAFFDQRDGRNNNLDPPIPFNANNGRENETFVPLLGNSGVEFTQGWGNLKTMKPGIHVEESLTLIGLPALDKCLAGYFGRPSERKTNHNILVPESSVQGVIQYFGYLIIAFASQFARTVRAVFVADANKADLQQRHLQATSKVEERIRREIKADQIASSHNAKQTTEPPKVHEGEAITTQNERDVSFWATPDQKEVWRRRHKSNPIFDFTVNVEAINIHQHPLFSAEEYAVSNLIREYDMYRDRMETYSLHNSIKDLLKFSLNRKVDGGSTDVRDFLDAAEKLVEETVCIKDMYSRVQKYWEDVLRARENAEFVCTDVDIEIMPVAIGGEFDADVKKLLDAISSLHSMTFDPQSNISIAKTLDAVEMILQNNLDYYKNKLNLIKTGNVAHNKSYPKEEKLRRKSISSERYFARLLIDNHTVGDTRRARIDWPSFSISISHCFRCNLSEYPGKLCIQVFFASAGFLPARLVSSIFVTIPHINRGSIPAASVPNPELYAFSSQNGLKGCMLVSTSAQVITTRSSDIVKVPRQIAPSNLMKLKSLQELQSEMQMPRLETDGLTPNRQFMMAFQCNNQTLLSTSLKEPPRNILLKKRQNNPKNVPSPIPYSTLESRISQGDIDYSSFLRQENEDDQEEIIDCALRERTAVNRKSAISVFKSAFEHSLRRTHRRVKSTKTYAEIVQDVSLYRFSGQNGFNLPIMQRKRSFAPTSSSQITTSKRSKDVSLLFSVVLGKNMPMRLKNKTESIDVEDSEEMNIGLVARIQLRGKSYYTRAVKCEEFPSNTPFWNETVSIDWINDEDHCNLLTHAENETVLISVFDCVDIDMRSHGGFYDDEDTRLLHQLYLGSASLPLSTLLRHGHFDGYIRCSSPADIVGYSKQSSSPFVSNTDDSDQHYLPHTAELMLRIYAATDPMITTPPRSSFEYQPDESSVILSRIKHWTRSYMQDSSFTVLWPNMNGISCLASRFLNQQNPPRLHMTPEACAHYVSLIPERSSWKALEMLSMDKNLLLPSQQVLNIIAGSREERAILLANFFLYLSEHNTSEYGADIYLILGFSIPEGNAVWVMRKCKRYGKIIFWEATSGCAYSSEEDSIPLQMIYCIVSNKNIYANLERKATPQYLDFDLTNTRKWAPLLDSNAFAPSSIQEEVLHYIKPNHAHARELQDELKEAIKSGLRDWRRVATSFRTDLVAKLTSILERKELAKMCGKEPDDVSLHVASKTRDIFGFALHFSFTNIQEIVDEIKATEIHNNRHPVVEYSVAVRVFAYPGGVTSVWVYICSLVPKA